MKIIGTTQNGYLIDATREEIIRLVGYHYDSKEPPPNISVGDEINVAAMFGQLYSLKRCEKDLRATAVKLREAADLLEAVPPIAREITAEPCTEVAAK